MKKWHSTLPVILFIAILTACGGREIAEPEPRDEFVGVDAVEIEPEQVEDRTDDEAVELMESVVEVNEVDETAEDEAEEAEAEGPTEEVAAAKPEATAQAKPTVAVSNAALTTGSRADADVIWVRAVQNGESWTFHVTVAHPDTGWEDYADGWDVVLPDGTVIKPDESSPFTRLLLHPHETEQPFTRSQSNIIIPADVTTVTVRAHDLVDGFGGQEITVDLTVASGEGFEVEN